MQGMAALETKHMKQFEQFRSKYSYAFADRVWGFVANEEDLEDKILFDFFADAEKIAKPHKNTLLHDLIYNVIEADLDYSTGHVAELEINRYQEILSEAEFSAPLWLNENEVTDHIYELDDLLGRALVRLVPSVFFILFSDRSFLWEFQALVARYVMTLSLTDRPDILRKDEVLKRPHYLPTWLKAAVFHRDKGRCQLCWKDLTGLMSPVHDLELDHILPLASSGSNDPSNFQLACRECNRAKGPHSLTTKPRFTPYW